MPLPREDLRTRAGQIEVRLPSMLPAWDRARAGVDPLRGTRPSSPSSRTRPPGWHQGLPASRGHHMRRNCDATGPGQPPTCGIRGRRETRRANHDWSRPDRWVDPPGSHPALNSIGVHALVRGTNPAGHPAYFRLRAETGRMGSPAGWASVHIPTLDWDLMVHQELYGLDPQAGDLTHPMQGAPVVVARGALTGPEGSDERGRSLNAQALNLIRAAIRHGSAHHDFCAVRPGPPPFPKEHQGDIAKAPTYRASSKLRRNRMKTS